MGGEDGIYTCILRLWEAGLSPFQESGAGLEDILSQYTRVFKFADPGAKNWDQAEQANQFCRGSAAMMVIFQAHFADHVYHYESSVYKENIGFAPLPSRTSVLGGWSLGIRAGSAMKEEARCFLEWISRDANSIPFNILGGTIPGNSVFNSFEMRETYPWLSPSFAEVQNTRSMIDNGIQWISQWKFETLAESLLNQLIRGQIDVKTAAETLRKKLANARKRYYD
jgi:ABC-type glycerol-3-phosphate transport system substrate-binding protein